MKRDRRVTLQDHRGKKAINARVTMAFGLFRSGNVRKVGIVMAHGRTCDPPMRIGHGQWSRQEK